MTTADRIGAIGYRAFRPVAALDYVGDHRAPGTVRMTVTRMLYVARHAMRSHRLPLLRLSR